MQWSRVRSVSALTRKQSPHSNLVPALHLACLQLDLIKIKTATMQQLCNANICKQA